MEGILGGPYRHHPRRYMQRALLDYHVKAGVYSRATCSILPCCAYDDSYMQALRAILYASMKRREIERINFFP